MPALPIDSELVDLCAAIYRDPAPATFSYIGTAGAVYFGISAGNRVTCRGSKSPEDWCDDAMAAIPLWTTMGAVPDGFWHGCREAAQDAAGRLDRSIPVTLTGHSLGAPHALYVAWLLHCRGFRVERVTLFESPHQGNASVRRAVAAIGFPVVGYCNIGDPVLTEPRWGVRCETEIIPLSVPPAAGDNSVFSRHHIWLIAPAVHALLGAAT